MRKLTATIVVLLSAPIFLQADVTKMVGDKIDAASHTTQTTTDKAAAPVEDKTKAVGLEGASKKVNQASSTAKKKTDLGAKRVKKAVGAGDAQITDTKKSANESKDQAIEQINNVTGTEAK